MLAFGLPLFAQTEFSYPAEMASLSYAIAMSTAGLAVEVGGYSHKLHVLLERLLERVANPTLDKERFEIQKALQLKEHANYFKGKPYSLARCATARRERPTIAPRRLALLVMLMKCLPSGV